VPDLLVGSDRPPKTQSPTDGAQQLVIPSDPAEAGRVQDHIERLLVSHRYEERERFSIKLAMEEALVNAIKHGNQLDRKKKVIVQYRISHERFDVQIIDEGKGFNPDDLPDPMAPENLERACGRGLLLIRHYMSEVNYLPPGNRLSMSLIRGYKTRNGNH